MTITNKEKIAEASKARVQFDFSKESLAKLDEITSTIHAATRAEVIRRALTLFTEVLNAEQRGARLMFEEKDGSKSRLILLV